MQAIFKKLSVAIAAIALLVATTAGTAFAQGNNSSQGNDGSQNNTSNQTQWFTDTISPLNNSGVQGFARLKLEGNQLTVWMTAWGLESNQVHVQHIHGMTDGSNGSCPTMAQNTDNDSTISLAEGLTTYGPILQPLTPFQMTGVSGAERYQQTFTVNTSDPTMDVLPLGNREIVIHGMTVAANQDLSNPAAGYDATLPVACGHIVPMFRTGLGNNNSSSVSISGNGAGSQNNVDIHSSNTTSVSQTNNTRVNNDVDTNLNTGNNHSSFNTGGDTSLNSGNATSSTSISTSAGMNVFSH